jgi:GNAT superfamily N-acetyltransferase
MLPCCWLRSCDPGTASRRHNGRVTTPCIIRAALPADEAIWRQLWSAYCEFYRAQVPDEVTSRTWKRILDPDSQIMCVVAEVEGQVYGFANCVVHENTWESQAICYLEDLFVLPAARRRGIASALLEWLRNAMRAEAWARLYWVTRADNAEARGLYDRFAQADGFVRYVIRQK